MIICEECGRSTITPWTWWRHVRKYHPGTTRDDWEFGQTNDYMAITGTGRLKRPVVSATDVLGIAEGTERGDWGDRQWQDSEGDAQPETP